MKKIALFAALAVVAVAPAAYAAETSQTVQAATEGTGVEVTSGKTLYGADGGRIAAIYRVNAQGNPQIILGGRMVTVSAATLSQVNGKLTTSLTKRELASVK